MRTPVSDPLRIGPYKIVGRLGSGGMGWVYLGRSPAGREVAVKVARPELASEPEFRERFAREVAAARVVSGAYTAAVVDADPTAELPWLATLYVPGPSLAEAVRADGPLPEAQVRPLGAGLVEALQAIHAAHVIHRDLKPANVLLAQDGPRVIDFGISRVDGAPGLTRVGVVVGTPPFMSPEQIRGDRVGPPSDVFSLGGVLVYALTGRPPHGSGEAVRVEVVRGEPRLDGVPAGLRPVIARCLAKRPEDRPRLAEILAQLMGEDAGAEVWPPPQVARTIEVRYEELQERHRHRTTSESVPSCLLLHAQALLDAGLTDAMVAGAVVRDGA
ncbi:serine/threonine protein kinase [Streptomyces europaeiscabiei]|uniref:serine/threonine-protein kinase n=1 Tax=Streptomyces TaxID=1883 RepID=UPI000A36C66E|nr:MULTISPECIES: serine/threonine-protein kinase [Streptomyces]MDX3588486.1 serine/threonine-protein kinase [Streptomyces europaeiscabiei]MDX3618122.1 serine/threonine-protein kinase [Streptomyces europaeiscabiei]MDX3637502.1 serine/threonine-protein kinase [Streptomyces europaeiscabiei]MDX3655490.1 serine/threonine-protein kinase [Streptomyces europaeiscabiei]WUD35152.1 serine/threonine protein kinase [Streptomyces europaeiscabiei]